MFSLKLAPLLIMQFVLLLLGTALALLGERREPDDLLRPDSLTGRHSPGAAAEPVGWLAGIDLDGPLATTARAVTLAIVPLSALVLWSGVPVGNPLFAVLCAAACGAAGFIVRRAINGSGFDALSFCAAAGALAIIVGRLTHAGAVLSSAAEGSAIGCTLLFGTAVSVRTGATDRRIFDRATLDIGQHNPLQVPFPHASTAQLRCALIALVVGGWLAASDIPWTHLGTAPAIFALLTSVSMQIWGWRAKELGPAGVAVSAVVAAVLTLLLRLVFNGTAGLRSLLLALKHTPFGSGLDSRGFVVLAGLLILIGAYELFSRPPDRLSRVVGHAPGWGWMLVGGLGAAVVAACIPGGGALAVTMTLTLCSGFLFVWLCQWE